ncbi:MAG: hypothetical protein U0235_27810 [Polyangiaceae bacterium]
MKALAQEIAAMNLDDPRFPHRLEKLPIDLQIKVLAARSEKQGEALRVL